MAGTLWRVARAIVLGGLVYGLARMAPPGWFIPNDPRIETSNLWLAGSRMTAAQAKDLARQSAQRPNDLKLRTTLLGYYFLHHSSPPDRRARDEQIYWILTNRPDSTLAGDPIAQINDVSDPGYARAAALWERQTESYPRNTAILGNAAEFFTLTNATNAESLFWRAASVEPKNPNWWKKLGALEMLGLDDTTGAVHRKRAGKALAAFTKARSLSTNENFDINGVATAALEADEYDQAQTYATQLLQTASHAFMGDGHGVHRANILLGRIALHKGDVQAADAYLLKAGDVPGAPTLESFGPNMRLAQDLLANGQKETVLKYFDLCAKFWDTDQLKTWRSDVESGRTPNFGANLVY